MSTQEPSDPGLQPERTELAWRRTALAIAIGALISLRVLPPTLPAATAWWGFTPGIIGLAAACALWFAARRRRLLQTARGLDARETSTAGAGLLLGLTLFTTGFGAVALALVIVPLLS